MAGLGCETNQISGLMVQEKLEESSRLHTFGIQNIGGTKKTVARSIELVEWMLEDANRVQRQPVPASQLVVGLQCGGSDGYSGISANPALGAAVDRLVRHGARRSCPGRPRSMAANTCWRTEWCRSGRPTS